MLGMSRLLYSSSGSNGSNAASSTAARPSSTSAAAVTMAAVAAGAAARRLHAWLAGNNLNAPGASAAVFSAPTSGGSSSGTGTKVPPKPQVPAQAAVAAASGRLATRSSSDDVGEHVEAAVMALAAMLGLGGLVPLLGPDGRKLGVDEYGRLVTMPHKSLLTGGPRGEYVGLASKLVRGVARGMASDMV